MSKYSILVLALEKHLFKKQFNNEGTEYSIGLVPLGGYVKISGMIERRMEKTRASMLIVLTNSLFIRNF